MKTLISIALVAIIGGCVDRPNTSELNFDSAHNIAVDMTIPAGKVVVPTNDLDRARSYVSQQLMYTIGQLNGISGGTDMNSLQVSSGTFTEISEGLYELEYAAKVLISWPRERDVPESYELVLPTRGDYQGRNLFFETYGADEDEDMLCLDWGAHDVTTGIFWYYYRPEKYNCPLKDASLDDTNIVVRVNANLAISGQNTEGKSPEYEKIWEDGNLVVTAIFGKNDHGATSNFDAGISAYRRMYQDLLSQFGEPVFTSLSAEEEPSAEVTTVELKFELAEGELDIHLYLVDSIRSVDQGFRDRYNERTKISDFVSYSGHSGLGANIRAMARMGEFVAGQYQLFLINGCDTFAYVDHALRDAHHAVNPDSDPNKYFDMITNAMPSYFRSNSRSNMAVINGMVGQAKTYREILADFDRAQRAAVTGEEDNQWPAPFDGQ